MSELLPDKIPELLNDYPIYDFKYKNSLKLLNDYGVLDKFWKLINDEEYRNLYKFCIQWGLDNLFKYLYQIKKIPFDAKCLAELYQIKEPNRKIITGRNEIITYFENIKCKSKYQGGKCAYIYIYHDRKSKK